MDNGLPLFTSSILKRLKKLTAKQLTYIFMSVVGFLALTIVVSLFVWYIVENVQQGKYVVDHQCSAKGSARDGYKYTCADGRTFESNWYHSKER